MQTKTKLKGVKERNYIRQWLGGSILALAVFMFGFLVVPYLVAEASAAEDVSAAVTWNTITLTLDPHGDIDFGEVIPSVRDTSIGNYGTQKVVKKAIDVTTEGNYFAVYLSTVDDDNSLATSGDTVQNIPAIGSNVASGFNSTSWGYAIPSQATATTFSAYDSYLATTFDLTANNLTKRGVGSAVYNTGSWSAVPALENTLQIYSNSTEAATGFSSGDSFNIYYSIMVDTDTMSGTYENQIVYTALASSQSLDTASQNVSRDKDIVTGGLGETETLQIDLASNLNLSTDKVKVYLVPHQTIVTENYSVENLTATDFPECTTSSVTSQGLSAVIICELPVFGETGATDSLEENIVEEDSEYDFWIQVVTPVNDILDYISHYRATDEDAASVAYKVALQSVDINGNRLISTMQQISGAICANTNMWGSGLGENARIYDKDGELGGNALLEAGEDEEGISSFLLSDTRDGKPYLVRRLANGECWMAQNLAIDLSTVGTLTPETSDISSSWTPNALEVNAGINGATTPRMRNHWLHYYDYSTNNELIDSEFNLARATEYIGGYYNLYAATANTGDVTATSQNASGSICPRGWQLPIVDAESLKTYDSSIATYRLDNTGKPHLLPMSILKAGYYDENSSNTLQQQRVSTHSWTATTGSNEGTAYDLIIFGTMQVTVYPRPVTRGATIRCVARD